MQPLDTCEDPTVVRDEVMRQVNVKRNETKLQSIHLTSSIVRLNREVVQGFVSLVQDLVHRPLENK